MNLLKALQLVSLTGRIPVLPDIKCISPKDGDLLRGRDPLLIAKELVNAGAPALSVVTERDSFGGSMDLLRGVCAAVDVPVLRKDFVEDEKDLDETKAAGADAVLLMVSCLGEERLAKLYHAALARGLTPFVETHTREEFAFAEEKLKAPLIGINNRDILVLEKDDGDVSHTARLLEDRSSNAFIIAESAMHTPQDVRDAIKAGACAALVGTGILTAQEPAGMTRQMSCRTGLKVCGLQNAADVEACLASAVEMCGFVTEYPVSVRWNLTREEAAPLLKRVSGKAKTCIVTGGSLRKVTELCRFLKPDAVQLHYTETLLQTQRIAQELKKEGIKVIRSIPLDGRMRKRMFGIDDLTKIIELLNGSDVSAILFDARDANNAADGGGRIFSDAKAAQEIRKACSISRKQVLVGGGVTEENAGEIIQALRPDLIDVMTGAENAKGSKSPEIIAALAETAAING